MRIPLVKTCVLTEGAESHMKDAGIICVQEEMGYIIMTLTPDPLTVRAHEAFLSLAAFNRVMFEKTLG